jgi:hypothetical protein
MQQDESFPLEAIPPRVKRALLAEFQGRWPTVQEVAQIPDRHWLTVPDIGPSSLERIRDITHARQDQAGSAARPRLTDAELLDRLGFIQGELRRIQRTLEARMGGALRNGVRGRDRAGSSPDEATSPE